MAYNDETAKAKLSQLNESQDSIMATGSWFMFFRYRIPSYIVFLRLQSDALIVGMPRLFHVFGHPNSAVYSPTSG